MIGRSCRCGTRRPCTSEPCQKPSLGSRSGVYVSGNSTRTALRSIKQPTLALVINGRGVSGITRNSSRVGQLDVRGTPDQSLDLQLCCRQTDTRLPPTSGQSLECAPEKQPDRDHKLTQGDQKVLLLATGQSDGQDSMSILLDYESPGTSQTQSALTHCTPVIVQPRFGLHDNDNSPMMDPLLKLVFWPE